MQITCEWYYCFAGIEDYLGMKRSPTAAAKASGMAGVDAGGGLDFDADDSAGSLFQHQVDFVAIGRAELVDGGLDQPGCLINSSAGKFSMPPPARPGSARGRLASAPSRWVSGPMSLISTFGVFTRRLPILVNQAGSVRTKKVVSSKPL
jgi:hypothetical protein